MWVPFPALVSILGKNMAETLCACRGGVPLYIPARANPRHELARIVGPWGMAALCECYPGEYITIPSGGTRKEAVLKSLAAGKSKRRTARECGVTLRYVCMLANLCSERTGMRQLSLLDLAGDPDGNLDDL
jgi:hypothetical protein